MISAEAAPTDPTDPPGAAHAQERAELVQQLVDAQSQIETTVLAGMTRELLSIPLTIQQLKVLAILGTEAEGNTVQGIATVLGVSLATMSGIIDRLTGQDMVKRVDDPHDLRVRRVVTTDAGRATIRRLVAARPQMEPAIVGTLPIEDLRALAQGVRALVAALPAPEPDHNG